MQFGIVLPLNFGIVTQRIRRRPPKPFPGKRCVPTDTNATAARPSDSVAVCASVHSHSCSATDRILLVTAHPDDESMFFGPALLCRHGGQQVKLLCLSTGNAEGLGETRKQELVRAAKVLGIPQPLVQTVDDPELQDGMDTVWPPEKIEEVVLAEVIRSRIHTVVTFDEDGVSGHINHRAVAHALANASERGRLLQENGRPARLFQLQTTGIVRKFLGLLDIFFSSSEKYLFLAPAGGFLAVWKAMALHESQVRRGCAVPQHAFRACLHCSSHSRVCLLACSLCGIEKLSWPPRVIHTSTRLQKSSRPPLCWRRWQ